MKCPSLAKPEQRYHSIAPCLAGKRSAEEQADALGLSYSAVCRRIPIPIDQTCRRKFMQGPRHETPLRSGAQTPQMWWVEPRMLRAYRGIPSIRVVCGAQQRVHPERQLV